MKLSPWTSGVATGLVLALVGFPPLGPPAAHAVESLREITEFRTYDGSGNNLANPDWGRAGTPLRRTMPADYADGISVPPELGLPGAREISSGLCTQGESRLNDRQLSDFFWIWGQFLDHDIDLTGPALPLESFDIDVPPGDPFFDPGGTGLEIIPFLRSSYSPLPGVRQQVNEITAFIDASAVYGSDLDRANELRTLDGTGRLETSDGVFLPLNLNGFPNAPAPDDTLYYLAGDVRSNEQAALTALHTLFVREHNYQADRIHTELPELTGEEVFQCARALVGAEMQAITYREYLPLLLGPNALAPYGGYDPGVHPGIENAFSSAAYRFGHSMLSTQLLQLDDIGQPLPQGPFPLRDVFFSPKLIAERGIEPFLRGAAAQPAQDIDVFVVDDVRNFLFGVPGQGGLDLAALNVQRGRDHGMQRYNTCRTALGLSPRASFAEMSSNPEIQERLAATYVNVDDVDLWAGGLSEDRYGNALVGETFFLILKDQFERTRAGDRFWYESHLPASTVQYVEAQTLAEIVRRNTSITDIQDDVFRVDDTVVAALSGASEPSGGGTVQMGLPFPNPTRTGSAIEFFVPREAAGPAEVAIFDARGRRVRTLLDRTLSSGRHVIRWDRNDDEGRRVQSGFYFVRFRNETSTIGRKMVLLD